MSTSLQTSSLRLVLLINATMFVLEFTAGLFAQSTGLVADSFDMLADAVVYGLSLAAVARTDLGRAGTARLSGWFQLSLGAGALAEVLHRFLGGSEPDPGYMMGVAAVALVANMICLRTIYRHRHEGVHMRASWIFSQNDVLANLGVIGGGMLVAMTGRPVWDLLVGTAIGGLVLSGGIRILRAAARARAAAESEASNAHA